MATFRQQTPTKLENSIGSIVTEQKANRPLNSCSDMHGQYFQGSRCADAKLPQMIQDDIQLLEISAPAHALSQQTPEGCF